MTYLIVNVQDISFSLGPEVLCVCVHGEVCLFAHTLQENRVPVLVVQKATQHSRGRDAAESSFAVICRGETGWSLSPGSFESCPSTALSTEFLRFPHINPTVHTCTPQNPLQESSTGSPQISEPGFSSKNTHPHFAKGNVMVLGHQ